jgi:hypothetical protein
MPDSTNELTSENSPLCNGAEFVGMGVVTEHPFPKRRDNAERATTVSPRRGDEWIAFSIPF